MKALLSVLLSLSFCLLTLQSSAQSAEELNKTGVEYFQQKQYKKALEQFSRAIVKKWGEPKYFWNRALTYQKLGKRDRRQDALLKSIKDYDRALRYFTSRDEEMKAKLYNGRGDSYFLLRKYKVAQEDYGKAKALEPTNSIYGSNYAIALAKNGQFDKASNAIAEVISSNSNRPEPYLAQARIYAMYNRSDDALNSFQHSVEKGFRDKEELKEHIGELAIITGDPKFKELLRKYKLEFDYSQTGDVEPPINVDNDDSVSGLPEKNKSADNNTQNSEVKLPPILTIEEITFSEKVLDAEEVAQLAVTVKNFGAGDAENVFVQLSGYLDDLNFPAQTNFPIIPKNGGVTTVKIDIQAGLNIPTAEALLLIEVVEPNFKVKIKGKQLKFPTRELRKPELILAKFGVVENLSAKPNNQIDVNEQIDVKLAVQNVGQGNADNVEILVKNTQDGVMFLGTVGPNGGLVRQNSTYKSIEPGKFETVVMRYFVNSEFRDQELKFELEAHERLNKYGFTDRKFVAINSDLKEEGYIRKIDQTDDDLPNDVIIEDIPDFIVDIHQDIPESREVNEQTYALIIGNEDYTKYQDDLGSESNVKFARADAQMFAAYCERTLAYPRKISPS